MSARPSDPVAVLRALADMLPIFSYGAHVLDRCARGVSFGRPVSWANTVLALEIEADDAGPDERAAFALAREALGAVEGGTVGK